MVSERCKPCALVLPRVRAGKRAGIGGYMAKVIPTLRATPSGQKAHKVKITKPKGGKACGQNYG